MMLATRTMTSRRSSRVRPYMTHISIKPLANQTSSTHTDLHLAALWLGGLECGGGGGALAGARLVRAGRTGGSGG